MAFQQVLITVPKNKSAGVAGNVIYSAYRCAYFNKESAGSPTTTEFDHTYLVNAKRDSLALKGLKASQNSGSMQ